jgi:predicted nicotinamide N-methyase
VAAAGWAAFIASATRLQAPPRVPELRLHLADEMTRIWELTEAELGAQGVDPPFWAFAWAGGQAVARHLLDTPAEVEGRTVLDLATGSGLVALAALLAGARHATAVDLDPVAAAAARLNAAANGLADRLTVTVGDLTAGAPPSVDVVLAGDVCYDRDMTAAVLPWLRRARAAGTRVLLGDPGRAYLPSQGLRRVAEYDVPTTADLEGREVCPSAVYELT